MTISKAETLTTCSFANVAEKQEKRFSLGDDAIVVTGMGLVCPLGIGVEESWGNLIAGKSGISALKTLRGWTGEMSVFPSRVAGMVPEMDRETVMLKSGLQDKEVDRVGRFIMLACIAANEALSQADWRPQDDVLRKRTGVLIGSGIGGLPEIERAALQLHHHGVRKVSPFFVPSALINLAAGQVAIQNQFFGPNVATVTACASGAHAIGEAAQLLLSGKADVMVAGGCESAVCPLGLAGFSQMKALSAHFNDTPEKASRPWDRRRDGFVISEGAGIVVLERAAHARARGAFIYGALVGYGLSDDAHHVAIPCGEGRGAKICMEMALNSAGIAPCEIDYINAHGTSTPLGDKVELRVLESIFPKGTLVSSTKSATGHPLGAAGAIEAIFSLLVLNRQILPPTLNLDDPEETVLDLIPHKARLAKDANYVLSNSFGFGGTNSTLIFQKAH